VRALRDLVGIENAFGQTREEAGRAAFADLSARPEQRGAWRQGSPEWEKIVLVTAGAVEQQERRSGR